MKGFPLKSQTNIGSCYKAVNAALKSAEECRTIEALKRILGEPDCVDGDKDAVTPTKIFKAMGSKFRFGKEDAEVVLIYADPYRPLFRYKFGFVNGVLDWTERETFSAQNRADTTSQA